jgi:hypothetical protein
MGQGLTSLALELLELLDDDLYEMVEVARQTVPQRLLFRPRCVSRHRGASVDMPGDAGGGVGAEALGRHTR